MQRMKSYNRTNKNGLRFSEKINQCNVTGENIALLLIPKQQLYPFVREIN